MRRRYGYYSTDHHDGPFARLVRVGRWLQRNAFLLFLALTAGVIVLNRVSPSGTVEVRATLTEILAPAIDAAGSPMRAVSGWLGAYEHLGTLRAERQQLQEEVEELRYVAAEAERLRRENAELRALLDAGRRPGLRVIAARVVFNSSTQFARSVVVNAGRQHGVRAGMAVMDKSGLVGRIVEVHGTNARVLLVTDINSRIPVMVGQRRIRAILAGGVDDRPVVQFMPRGAEAAVGDEVLTSGHGGVLPRGLAVGRVVEKSETGAAVRLAGTIGSLGFVRILAPVQEGAMRDLVQNAIVPAGYPRGGETE